MKNNRIVLALTVPVVAVLFAAIGFGLGRLSASGALPPGADLVTPSSATQTAIWTETSNPTETPTSEPTSTPEPTATPIGPPVSLEGYDRLFNGVFYKREENSSPRPYIAHIVIIELDKKNIRLMVTPKQGLGQTTSSFLQSYGLALAINGDGWWNEFDPAGFAVSDGEVYSEASQEPTIYILKNGRVKIGGNAPERNLLHAISGSHLLVKNGQISERIRTCGSTEEFCQNLAPRTSVGISAGNYLIIVVVEGPPSEPRGALTLEELAELHLELGSLSAIAMDGGGSTTLVVRDGSEARILNSPTDGSERTVANHLGIYAPSPGGGGD